MQVLSGLALGLAGYACMYFDRLSWLWFESLQITPIHSLPLVSFLMLRFDLVKRQHLGLGRSPEGPEHGLEKTNPIANLHEAGGHSGATIVKSFYDPL